MLESYLQHIQEGYLFSDKTISVNLNDFESGKKNKLIVVGVMGSGKTTIGEHLSKKYKVKWISVDSFWWRLKQKYFKNIKMTGREMEDKLQDKFEALVIKHLKSNERLIIEGINLMEPKYRKLVLKQPMIILGISSLRAGLRGGMRNRKRGDDGGTWKLLYWMPEMNMRKMEPVLKLLRKDVSNLSGANIKEYK